MSRSSSMHAPGVRLVLTLVAIVPLLGICLLSFGALSEANRESEVAFEIAGRTETLGTVIQLQADLTNESYWAIAIESVAALGLPPELIADQFGIDLLRLNDEAKAETDAAVELLGLTDVAVELENIRAQADRSGANGPILERGYSAIVLSLKTGTQQELNELTKLSFDSSSSQNLGSSVRVLEAAVELGENASEMNSAYFATRIASSRGAAEDGLVLLEQSSLYRSNLLLLAELVAGNSELEERLDGLQRSAAVIGFVSSVESLGASLIVDGVPTNLSLASLDLETERDQFVVALDANGQYSTFVAQAAADVVEASASLQDDAEHKRDRTLLLVFVCGMAALLAVLFGGWWIARPLRRMAGAVAQLRDGQLGTDQLPVDGPREVRVAAVALNEAMGSLRLAESQAIALSNEELDDPILERSLPGTLGASLQGAVARLAESLTAREDIQERLAHQASHDGLTGLLNRTAIMAQLTGALSRAERAGYQVGVLFIDFDGFKTVNDNHGHSAGDEVLQEMANRLAAAARGGDQVGRLGGDEFVVIAEPVANVNDVLTLAERIMEDIQAPLSVGSIQVQPGASIGVALSDVDRGLTADELVRDADMAVYKAKREGRARVELCDDGLRAEIANRLEVERALRVDITQDRLFLLFQPIMDTTKKIVGLEALVRWRRSTGELVQPDDFIEIAERSDLIIDVDNWVLNAAAQKLAEWQDHPVLSHTRLSVNLSARHLSAPNFVSDILDPLREHEANPNQLTVEITESAMLHNTEAAVLGLNQLRAFGVHVAIDDFGTGYTSLANLRQLPVDVLKVDRSFVNNLDQRDDHSLVRLTIETGHLLGLSIVAEGVETEEQASELRSLGSDHMQGYLFSRPELIQDLLDSDLTWAVPSSVAAKNSPQR